MDPEQLAAKLRNLTAPFTSGQLVTLALTFVVVISVVIASAMWLQKPTYRLLQSDLDSETMGQVVARLKSLKVPYELDEGGEFDPRQVPDPPRPTSVQDARIGGWGIPIVRHFSDGVRYRHEDGRNCLTLLFRPTAPP